MKRIKEVETGLSSRDIDEILLFAKRFPEIENIILFGSRAKGTYKPGSDIDLALSGALVSYSIINELAYLLNEESTLPYYFDVLNMSEISSLGLLTHIKECGVQLKDSF